MKKKLFIISLFAIFMMFVVSPTSFAADATISTGGLYDLDTYGDNSTITVSTTQAITFTNSSTVDLANFQIVCSVSGANLTIDEVYISNDSFAGMCPLVFTGANNTLTLVNYNGLAAGLGVPAVKVETGTSLEILGDGALEAYGGNNAAGIGSGDGVNAGNILISNGGIRSLGGFNGAGIGGGSNGNSGTITITDGYVDSSSPDNGAGIGGGNSGNSGTITIRGGEIYAESYDDGAGIGGGDGGDGGNITISGGFIDASSDKNGAGIGGGNNGDSGTITISGGIIDAYAYENGAGIGGGNGGSGGNIVISGGNTWVGSKYGAAGIGGGDGGDGGNITFSGGIFYAEGDSFNDIGSGIGGVAGSINIEGSAVVLLYENQSDYITTSTHSLHSNEEYDGIDAYGYSIPPWWSSGTAYAYIKDNFEPTIYKRGNLSGTLADADGNGLEGFKITLYSRPKNTTTNSAGVFSYSNVEFSNHWLAITTPEGREISRYTLNFSKGIKNDYSISGDTITILYTDSVSSVHITFRTNEDQTSTYLYRLSFVDNPQTSDENTFFENVANWFNSLFH